MLKQQTIEKLKKMKMGALATAAEALDRVPNASAMPKEDWLALMVDHLYEEKMSTKLANLLKDADLPCPDAYLEDLCTDADRCLDLGLVDKLAMCDYISKGHNVVIMGASGAGKSWLASALALCACNRYIRVASVCTQEMADELGVLRENPPAHAKRIKELKNVPLLLVDDWLAMECSAETVDELFAVVDARTRGRKSTIVCTQYMIEGWPGRMGGFPTAESVVDRLKNSSYQILLKGEVSMRERFMDEELRAYAQR